MLISLLPIAVSVVMGRALHILTFALLHVWIPHDV